LRAALQVKRTCEHVTRRDSSDVIFTWPIVNGEVPHSCRSGRPRISAKISLYPPLPSPRRCHAARTRRPVSEAADPVREAGVRRVNVEHARPP
jgi:hypothetical protein